jgi:hypothetical protein
MFRAAFALTDYFPLSFSWHVANEIYCIPVE